jgi:hypothetical protein
MAATTGTLTTGGGTVIALSGTLDGSVYNVSGGGYTITATVDGLQLSGTGTAPGGQTASLVGASGTSYIASQAYCGRYDGTAGDGFFNPIVKKSGTINFVVDWGRTTFDVPAGTSYAKGLKAGQLVTTVVGYASTSPVWGIQLFTPWGNFPPSFFKGSPSGSGFAGTYDSDALYNYQYENPEYPYNEKGTWSAAPCGATPVPPAPTTPTPGAYVGPYRLLTTETYRNSTGALDPVTKNPIPFTCQFNLEINGTVTVTTQGSGGTFEADVNDSFTETQLSTTCPFAHPNAGTLSGGAVDYKGSPSAIRAQTSNTITGNPSGSRTHDFSGALNGNIITGTVTKTFSSSGTPPASAGAPPGTVITGNYGPSTASVILQKR